MGAHLVNGSFQSDKYPTCPPGKVPLSVKDPAAQDLLWEYAQRRRKVDAEFSDDLETALRDAGYEPKPSQVSGRIAGCLVAFGDDMREDDADVILTSIRMLRHVIAVTPHPRDPNDFIIRERVHRDFRTKVLQLLQSVKGPE